MRYYGNVMTTIWRLSVTMETLWHQPNGDYALLDFYIFNSTVVDWTCFFSFFFVHGVVNKQNHRYWSDTNPNWRHDCKEMGGVKVMVWCGIWGTRIIGPYFIHAPWPVRDIVLCSKRMCSLICWIRTVTSRPFSNKMALHPKVSEMKTHTHAYYNFLIKKIVID